MTTIPPASSARAAPAGGNSGSAPAPVERMTPEIARLPSGAMLQGQVAQSGTRGELRVATDIGELVLKTALRAPEGSTVQLQLQPAGSGVRAVIVSLNPPVTPPNAGGSTGTGAVGGTAPVTPNTGNSISDGSVTNQATQIVTARSPSMQIIPGATLSARITVAAPTPQLVPQSVSLLVTGSSSPAGTPPEAISGVAAMPAKPPPPGLPPPPPPTPAPPVGTTLSVKIIDILPPAMPNRANAVASAPDGPAKPVSPAGSGVAAPVNTEAAVGKYIANSSIHAAARQTPPAAESVSLRNGNPAPMARSAPPSTSVPNAPSPPRNDAASPPGTAYRSATTTPTPMEPARALPVSSPPSPSAPAPAPVGAEFTPRTAPSSAGPAPLATTHAATASTATGTVSNAVANTVAHTVTGTVTGSPPGGGVILATPVGQITIAANGGLPPGSIVRFEMAVSGRGAEAMGSTAEQTQPGIALARNWPALSELAGISEEMGLRNVSRPLGDVIPQPGPRLAQTMLFFISALRLGDVSRWLGPDTMSALRASGRASLAARLGEDFSQLARTATEGAQGDWRAYLLPFHDGERISQIRFFHRRYGNDGEGTGDGDDARGDRFLIDLELSRLGTMQLDGHMKSARLDLILRSGASLGAGARRDISAIFQDGCACAGVTGDIRFADREAFAPLPFDFGDRAPAGVSV